MTAQEHQSILSIAMLAAFADGHKADTERDYFLTADEAKDYGLVDQVIHKRS